MCFTTLDNDAHLITSKRTLWNDVISTNVGPSLPPIVSACRRNCYGVVIVGAVWGGAIAAQSDVSIARGCLSFPLLCKAVPEPSWNGGSVAP
jgi:hypothetical protein